jgi:hypothetical protein
MDIVEMLREDLEVQQKRLAMLQSAEGLEDLAKAQLEYVAALENEISQASAAEPAQQPE